MQALAYFYPKYLVFGVVLFVGCDFAVIYSTVKD